MISACPYPWSQSTSWEQQPPAVSSSHDKGILALSFEAEHPRQFGRKQLRSVFAHRPAAFMSCTLLGYVPARHLGGPLTRRIDATDANTTLLGLLAHIYPSGWARLAYQLSDLGEGSRARDVQRRAVVPIHPLEVSPRRYILLDALQISPERMHREINDEMRRDTRAVGVSTTSVRV